MSGSDFSPKFRLEQTVKIIGFVIGLVLLAWIILNIDFSTFGELISQINIWFFVFGACAYLATMGARAYRFLRLTNLGMKQFRRMSAIVIASSLTNQILPARLGELTYIYLAKRNRVLLLGQGFASLLLARLLDILSICLLYLAGVLLIYSQLPQEVRSLTIIASIVIVGIVVVIFLLIFGRHWLSNLAILLISNSRLVHRPVYNRIVLFIREIEKGFELQGGKEIYLVVLANSILTWLLSFIMLYLLLVGMGIPASIGETLIGATFAGFTSIIPINSFGNFGTFEAGWTMGFTLTGVSYDFALAVGFALHILNLGYAVVFGTISWVWLIFLDRNRAQSKN